MTKEERKLIERLACYATLHQDEHEDFIHLAYALWRLSQNDLKTAEYTLTDRGL